jgi:muconolactone delta-isomerase
MTTHVPDGTSEQTVEEVKGREAAHSAKLGAQGHLLRLWRPPLAPGEWRSFGLFAASDAEELEAVLTSMPLRIWRSDDVTPLGPHPNDPGVAGRAPLAEEFLIRMAETPPPGTSADAVTEAHQREHVRVGELAREGHVMRLWRITAGPDQGRALGLWAGDDEADMDVVLESLPLYRWLTIQTTPLSPHPSDPALAS